MTQAYSEKEILSSPNRSRQPTTFPITSWDALQNNNYNILFICHIAELTELKGYKLQLKLLRTTIETIKISLKTIHIFTYLLANEIKEPERWVRQQLLSA